MMIQDVTIVTSFHHNSKAYLHVTYFGTLHNNEQMEVAVCERLQVQELSYATQFINLCSEGAHDYK
jgi:hypothetical protein